MSKNNFNSKPKYTHDSKYYYGYIHKPKYYGDLTPAQILENKEFINDNMRMLGDRSNQSKLYKESGTQAVDLFKLKNAQRSPDDYDQFTDNYNKISSQISSIVMILIFSGLLGIGIWLIIIRKHAKGIIKIISNTSSSNKDIKCEKLCTYNIVWIDSNNIKHTNFFDGYGIKNNTEVDIWYNPYNTNNISQNKPKIILPIILVIVSPIVIFWLIMGFKKKRILTWSGYQVEPSHIHMLGKKAWITY